MNKFLLLAKNGTTPPAYQHDTIESAIIEGRRLHDLNHTDVLILEIVGEIKFTQVPVTTEVTLIDVDDRFKNEEFNRQFQDDLPF